MKHLLALAALLVAGCSPVVYVPPPIPTAPVSTGVRAGASVNPFNGRSALRLDVSPVEGVAILGRGLFAQSLVADSVAGGYRHRGAEAGILGTRAVSGRVMVDGGLFVGRDRVEATEQNEDDRYLPIEATTSRTGGHIGALLVRETAGGDAVVRFGPAVRLTRLSVSRDGVVDAQATFVEQAVRVLVTTPRFELDAQVGATRELGPLLQGYDYRPFIGTVGVLIRLDRF